MALNSYALFHECGHFVLHAKDDEKILLETRFEQDYASWDPEFLQQKFLELMGKIGDGLKKRGRRPIFSHEQIMELEILRRTTRPRDHGIGLETRSDGWVWTVDLFRELILRLHPNKQCSRATADRLLREFKEKR
jgi:hypothetical protein